MLREAIHEKRFNRISDAVVEHVNDGGDDCSALWRINWVNLAGRSAARS